MNKWRFALQHAWPSLIGFAREMFLHPSFAFRLFFSRLDYFLRRRMDCPLNTPNGFVVETPNELISYWSFFIEREGCDRTWLDAVKTETRPIVIDVGANAGLFSHLIWTLNPNSKIIVFEPLPRMASKIAAWKERTGAAIQIHNAAVSSASGNAKFFVSSDNDTTASLRDDGTKTETVSVPVVTLDSTIAERSILLIKIDVEGLETEVLKGAKKTLENTVFLLIEAHTKDDVSRLEIALGEQWVGKRVGASDYLFKRKNC